MRLNLEASLKATLEVCPLLGDRFSPKHRFECGDGVFLEPPSLRGNRQSSWEASAVLAPEADAQGRRGADRKSTEGQTMAGLQLLEDRLVGNGAEGEAAQDLPAVGRESVQPHPGVGGGALHRTAR